MEAKSGMGSMVGCKSFVRSELRLGIKHPVWLTMLMLIALALGFSAYVVRLQAITHDAFHEMALIRYWFSSGAFPHDDVFAFTPTVSPAVHHEWATGLFLYWADAFLPGEYGGLSVLRWLMIAGLGCMLYRVARNAGASPILFALVAPIAFPLIWVGFATVRAQLFTLLAIAAQLLMMQSDWRGRRSWVWIWIPMYLVWLNVHAGFVVGIGMLGFHGIERSLHAILHPSTNEHRRPGPLAIFASTIAQVWHLLALVPILLIGVLVNPWGSDYLPYLIRAITMPRPTMLEWQPLWFTYQSGIAMLCYATTVAALIYVAWMRRSHRLRGWLFCALAAYMALMHIRHGSIYGVLWIALVPAWLTPTPLGRVLVESFSKSPQQVMRWSCVVSLCCFVFLVAHQPWKTCVPASIRESEHCYPVGAVQYLAKSGFEGNILTPFHAGSYVTWSLYPKALVSMDGRYEVAYDACVLPAHNRFYRAQAGWRNVLQLYNCDIALIPTDSPVFKSLCETRLHEDLGWSCDYRDDSYWVLKRIQ